MTPTSDSRRTPDLDALIIGAGISGLKQLYELRKRGLKARIFEAGDGIGGTWYWNRYPGCRFDVESYTYGYFFDQEMLVEWTWSEEFATQPEIERYLHYVADRLDLWPDVQLSTRVASAHWDEDSEVWVVTDTEGRQTVATYLVTAVGILSAPNYPPVGGRENFAGEMYHTGLWPDREVDFAGKRIAVIGTGSSGVQIIPIIAEEATELTVFQRSANWCTPLGNFPITPERMDEIRGRYDKIDEIVNNTTASGFMHIGRKGSLLELPEEEREAFLESIYYASGMTMLYLNYEDVTSNREANAIVNDFLARKIRERVKDPKKAEALIPKDHGFGSKRPPQETDYYEAYNRDTVHIVSTREEPMLRFTETGIETSAGHYEFDMIVFATGFESITGSYNRIDIRGKGGQKLKDAWGDGPLSYYGFAVPGFPNMFMAAGPQSTRGNLSRFSELQTGWIADCVEYVQNQGGVIEATEAAARAWSDHVQGQASEPIFFDKDARSWTYQTDTTSGRAVLLVGTEGLPAFRERIQQTAKDGYEGFVLTPRR